MSIHAQIGDSTVLEFPDGTAQSVIDRAVQDYVKSQKPKGKGEDAGRGFVAGAIEGVAAIPGMVGDIWDATQAAEHDFNVKRIDKRLAQGKITKEQADRQKAREAALLQRSKELFRPMTTKDYVEKLPAPVQAAAEYEPETRAGRYAKVGGSFLPMAIPGVGEIKAASTPGKLAGLAAKQLAMTGASAIGSEGAREFAEGAGAGQIGQTAAAVAGAVAAPLSFLGAARGAGAVKRAAEPFVASVNPEVAESLAGRIIADRATDPTAAAAALGQDATLVPGSIPTTFQQSGDMGLGALEREMATSNPIPFRERAAEQNAARVTALTDIQHGADPNDVSRFLKEQFDALDNDTQAAIDTATTEAQQRTAAIGGNAAPEALGENLRSVITDAESAARQREGALWRAVDPEGDLTGNVSQTSSAAKEAMAKIGKTAKPMAGEEAAIFQVASELPPLSPVSDLIELRSRVSTEMRNELMANGRSPSYARLTGLRGAIQDNLSHTIGQQIANEAPAIARGALAEADSTAARVQGWVDEFRVGQKARSDNRGGIEPVSPGGSPGDALRDGEQLSPAQGPGSLEGDQSLQGLPTFDADASQRLAEATTATRERAGTFNGGPVGSVTAKAGSATDFRLPDGRVPSKFFHPGPTGFSDMQALFKAVPEAKSLPVVEEYAASSLRKAAVSDGVLDPAKFERWKRAHADSLRALPDATNAKFDTAASAAQAVEEATLARTVALKEAQAGAIGKVMGMSDAQDVVRQVGRIFNGSQPVKDMMSLARATKGNAEARAGLRQAVADYIQQALVSNTEGATSGVTLIKADGFQTFFKKNKAALDLIFTPNEVEIMGAIGRDIQRAKRSETAIKLPGGSNTVQDALAAARNKSVMKSVLSGLAGALGSFHGPIGAIAGYMGADLTQAMRQAGISKIDQLVTEGMLNPAVGRRLLMAASSPPPPQAKAALARAIRTSQIAAIEAKADQ